MKKKCLFIAAGVAAMDQAIKIYVRTRVIGETMLEIPGLFLLTHSVNTGAAFSLFSGQTLLLIFFSLSLFAFMYVFVLRRMRLRRASWAALACMLGGGIGNLLDRVFFGGVTDYIRLLFIDFPIFNLADIAITGSVFVLIILLITDTLEETAEEEHGTNR